MIRSFELEGAEVAYLFTVQMGGMIVEQIDGAVHTNGRSCLIECKDQAGNVNIDPIAKLKNQLSRRPNGVIGSMVSSTSFTEATVYLSQYNMNQAVLLWNSDDITYGLTQQFMSRGLFRKYWYCVQTGKTDYNLLLEGVL